MDLDVLSHQEPIVQTVLFILLVVMIFCTQTIMLHNKPTIAVSSICGSKSS